MFMWWMMAPSPSPYHSLFIFHLLSSSSFQYFSEVLIFLFIITWIWAIWFLFNQDNTVISKLLLLVSSNSVKVVIYFIKLGTNSCGSNSQFQLFEFQPSNPFSWFNCLFVLSIGIFSPHKSQSSFLLSHVPKSSLHLGSCMNYYVAFWICLFEFYWHKHL